jgi:hypothetical protein
VALAEAPSRIDDVRTGCLVQPVRSVSGLASLDLPNPSGAPFAVAVLNQPI